MSLQEWSLSQCFVDVLQMFYNQVILSSHCSSKTKMQ
uniref:Uncharacterized protein n=1 Tax=Anguilla anguilla TaxID=7936 RepID=A0A0E9VCH8_ANGAN